MGAKTCFATHRRATASWNPDFRESQCWLIEKNPTFDSGAALRQRDRSVEEVDLTNMPRIYSRLSRALGAAQHITVGYGPFAFTVAMCTETNPLLWIDWIIAPIRYLSFDERGAMFWCSADPSGTAAERENLSRCCPRDGTMCDKFRERRKLLNGWSFHVNTPTDRHQPT